MRVLLLVAVLLSPAAAHAGPRLDLEPALRAFIDLAMVEALEPKLEFRLEARGPLPPSILGGPTPADPAEDPSALALNALQYGLAIALGLGTSTGDTWQDRSVGELPGLVRNADIRGGRPFWSKERSTAP